MTREELIARLTWNDGGYSLSGMAAMEWALSNGPDIPSTVSLCAPPDQYTDDELREIVTFANWKDEQYDKLFSVKRGCNGILFDKIQHPHMETAKWVVKRFTWESGYGQHDSLTEAIAWMTEHV